MAERSKPLTQTKKTNRSLKINLKWGTLTELCRGQWKVNWIDSKGLRRRVQLKAETPAEAERKAEAIYHNPPRKGQKSSTVKLVPVRTESPLIMISDALYRSAQDRNWTKENRLKDQYNCKYFLQWADSEGLTYWHELRFEHISCYMKGLIDRRLAYDTIRLYLSPVRRAARWVTSNWPKHHTNISESLNLSNSACLETNYNDSFGNPVLLVPEVLDFLDWLTQRPVGNRLSVGVVLQGLAGLQIQEALRLTWGKVDFKAETITIDGEVKNRYRIRRIPVVKLVFWLLRQVRELESCPQPEDPVLPWYSDYSSYAKAIRKALKAWNHNVSIKPKDLRNTIQTAAVDGGWYGYYVQRYVGHAPKTIGERHYHGDQGYRLLPFFREKVVNCLEEEIANWVPPAASRLVPGPRLLEPLFANKNGKVLAR